MSRFIKAPRLFRNKINAYTVPFNAQKLANILAEEDEIALLKDWADHNQR